VRPKSASDTLIYVQIAKQKSNFIAYKITPNYDYATLSLSDYDQSKCVIFTMGFMGESNASWSIDKDRYDADWAGKRGDLWGQHRGGRSTGYNGNDEYYKGIALQNNWVVDDIQFNVWDQPWNPRPIIPSDGMVILQESHNGTNLPYLNVRWAVNPYYNIVSYEIIVTIKGPRGYSWK
jgi:hypothetical protein